LSAFVVVFIISLLIPISVELGSVRLSAYRVVLLITMAQTVRLFLSGQAGAVRVADISVFVICFWSSLSLIVLHGIAEVIEPVGILNIELLGAYLLGRVYIRTPDDFYKMVRLLFIIGMIMLPFAIFEAITGQKLFVRLFALIGADFPHNDMGKRLGLTRVQGTLEHPILYGVFFGSLIGLVYYVLGYGRSFMVRVFATLLIFGTGALSLSSGPLAAMTTQLYLVAWDTILKGFRQRWYVFLALCVLAYITVDTISTRDPFRVFAYYFSFSAETAYNRIFIFDAGVQNMLAYPVFGIGQNDWERAAFMSSSFDMFWMLQGMTYGVIVLVGYLTFFFSIIFAVVWVKDLDERVSWHRMGFVTTMFGFFIAGWTVHYWNTTYVHFVFISASGIWIADHVGTHSEDQENAEEVEGPKVLYTRFRAAGADTSSEVT